MASQPYAIHLDTLFASLQLVDIQKLVDGCRDGWYNQTLCRVNDCVVRLGMMQGEFHWHKHDHEDEFFYVIEGRWVIDLEGGRSSSGRGKVSRCRRASCIARAPRSAPSFS